MKPLRLAAIAFACLATLLACQDDDASSSPQTISPQPQPSQGNPVYLAPCSSQACGEIPSGIQSPRCKQKSANDCAWVDESGSTSFRQCDAGECGAEPSPNVCAVGTSFKGSTCGSENEGACIWRTSCSPPRSTTACPEGADGCGPQPAIGVICSDGGTGGLECMERGGSCFWQTTCE